MRLFAFILLLFSSIAFAQPSRTSQDIEQVEADNQSILEKTLEHGISTRCVPADKNYTHFGAVDEKTIILANKENDALIATLRKSCPRVLEEDRILLLFRKGDGLSRIGSRICADDAFMMIRSEAVSVKNPDSLRACEFKAFYPLPVDDALMLIRNNGILMKGIGVL